jgi:Leucine-rich repeat (LRR) protein
MRLKRRETFSFSCYYPQDHEQVLKCARGVAPKNSVTEIWLRGNAINCFPAELCELFPNVEVCNVGETTFSMLPREICHMTHLRNLSLNDTNICVLPSTITKLTNLCALSLEVTLLPLELRKYVCVSKESRQHSLNFIVSYFELARRSATVLVGLRKLKRSQILGTFYVPIEFILEIAQLVCSSHGDPKWEPARSAQTNLIKK